MKTEKRKAQQREASKKTGKTKSRWVEKISIWIGPDWKKEISEILDKLRSK